MGLLPARRITTAARFLLGCILGACLVGCASIPITDGFPLQPPADVGRTVVLGNHPSAVSTVTAWLRKHGAVTVDAAQFAAVLQDRPMTTTIGSKHEAAVLEAAAAQEVRDVVFVTYSGDIRAPLVTVRNVRVPSAEVEWGGSARYGDYAKRPLPDAVANLACEALATAWGFHKPGRQWRVLFTGRCETTPSSDH